MSYKLLYAVLGHWKTVPVSSFNTLRGRARAIAPPDETNGCLWVVAYVSRSYSLAEHFLADQSPTRRLFTYYFAKRNILFYFCPTHCLTAKNQPA